MSHQITALHGMLGKPEDWEFLPVALGPQFTLESPNLWENSWRVGFDQIGSRINSHTAGDVLLGYSLGGRLALHALAENPTRWRAAIIISAHPGLDEPDRPTRLLADRVWAQKARNEIWTDFLEDWNAQPVFAGSPIPGRSHLEPYREAIADAFDHWSLARQENFLPKFSNIPTPTIWITGENDQKFTALAKLACQQLPNAQHAIIPAANHRPHLENPPYFFSTIQAFFESDHKVKR